MRERGEGSILNSRRCLLAGEMGWEWYPHALAPHYGQSATDCPSKLSMRFPARAKWANKQAEPLIEMLTA
jgi:hypothetical protein